MRPVLLVELNYAKT